MHSKKSPKFILHNFLPDSNRSLGPWLSRTQTQGSFQGQCSPYSCKEKLHISVLERNLLMCFIVYKNDGVHQCAVGADLQMMMKNLMRSRGCGAVLVWSCPDRWRALCHSCVLRNTSTSLGRRGTSALHSSSLRKRKTIQTWKLPRKHWGLMCPERVS